MKKHIVAVALFLSASGHVAFAREQDGQGDATFQQAARSYALNSFTELVASEAIRHQGILILESGTNPGQSYMPLAGQLKAMNYLPAGYSVDGVIKISFEPGRCERKKQDACTMKLTTVVNGKVTAELFKVR